jgi:hypothetical protein
MESWPRDYGAHPTANREQRQSGWHIPERGLGTLDITGGRIGGATLIPDHDSQDNIEGSKGSKLKWSFAKIGNQGTSIFSRSRVRFADEEPRISKGSRHTG